MALWLPEPDLKEMWLRFVDGRPVSSITTQFLGWCCERLWAKGKKVLVMVWDNAGWHISKVVRAWIKEHNWQVKQKGKGVRSAHIGMLASKQKPLAQPY